MAWTSQAAVLLFIQHVRHFVVARVRRRRFGTPVGDSSPRFTWQLRATTKGPNTVAVYVRQHMFEAGAPLQFDSQDDHVSPLEYLLGAFVADLVGGLHTLARRRRVAIEEVEAVVEGELENPLTHLGVVGEDGRPCLSRARVHVFARSLADEAHVRRIWEEMLEKSPLVSTLRPTVELELSAIDAVEQPGPTTQLLVLEVKAAAAETAATVTEVGIRACGGAAFSRHLGLERFFRDARAAIVMAPTTDHLHEFIGRALCGMEVF